MASEGDTARFEADTRKMVDDLAISDPKKLEDLAKASAEMKKAMEEDPEMFKKTFRDFLG